MIGKIIWLLVQGLIFLYIQLLLMPAFEIFSVIPSLLLPWMIYSVWKKPFEIVVPIVFVIALMYDLSNPLLFGLQAMSFMILCIGIDVFRIPFEASSTVAKVFAVVLSNLLYSVLGVFVHGMILGFASDTILVYLIAFLINTVFSFVIFWAMEFLSKLRIIVADQD